MGSWPDGIVERQRGFAGAEGAARRRAVEDDVGHFAAAERLGTLRTEDPFHGIDDIRLAGAVWTNDDGDSAGKVEPSAIGETLEAGEFQGLEHGGE